MASQRFCEFCFFNYDTTNRLPFIGLCGHVYCSLCITTHKLRECPSCGDTEGFSVATCNFDFLEKLAAAENLLLFVNNPVIHQKQPGILEMRNDTNAQLVPSDTSDEEEAEVEDASEDEVEEEEVDDHEEEL